jgi:hypothetical protein
MAGRKGRSTRRNKPYKKHLTIPEIKQGFDTIGKATHDILKEGGSPAEQVKKFQKAWKSVFHRPVGSSEAEAYLKMKRISGEKRNGGTRKRKGQKGGAALSGAPLDYSLRPGVEASHSYGNFPEYQVSGLSAYDKINQEGMFQECGTKDITPNIYASGQSGGDFTDAVHKAFMSPSEPSVPPGAFSDSQQILAGRSAGASPAPYVR